MKKISFGALLDNVVALHNYIKVDYYCNKRDTDGKATLLHEDLWEGYVEDFPYNIGMGHRAKIVSEILACPTKNHGSTLVITLRDC